MLLTIFLTAEETPTTASTSAEELKTQDPAIMNTSTESSNKPQTSGTQNNNNLKKTSVEFKP